MTADKPIPSALELAHTLDDFLERHPRAVLLEEGRVLFDLATDRYSLSTGHGRCVLHLWSEERNLVRTVVAVRPAKDGLRIQVRRLGSARPGVLTLVAERDRRAPAALAMARNTYLRTVEQILSRDGDGFTLEGWRSAMDLEHSFGPGYARGMLVRGQRCWAVVGVNAAETPATIDGVLTAGILWLDYCRERNAGKRVVQGLKVLAPAGRTETTRARMAWLSREAAQWELYELSEGAGEFARIDAQDQGNLEMRLTHAFQPEAAVERLRASLEALLRLLPDGMRQRAAAVAKSPEEVALALHGLEFARIRYGYAPDSFQKQASITFGAGANETPLDENSEAWFLDLMHRLESSRTPAGSSRDPLFRMQPERWLESVLKTDLSVLDPGLRSDFVYTQTPSFAGGDRGVLDLLAVTRTGRLAVVELKAEEDMHLPLQALDYWIRVHTLHRRAAEEHDPGELQRSGYFPGLPLDPRPPLLYFVAPSLHVHPTMETVLRYLSPEIPWTLIALNEGWRQNCQVVFRKHGRTHG